MMYDKKEIILYIEDWFDIPVWERSIFLEQGDYQGFYEAVQNFFDAPMTEIEWLRIHDYYPDLVLDIIDESFNHSKRISIESVFQQPCSVDAIERISLYEEHSSFINPARYKIYYSLIN